MLVTTIPRIISPARSLAGLVIVIAAPVPSAAPPAPHPGPGTSAFDSAEPSPRSLPSPSSPSRHSLLPPFLLQLLLSSLAHRIPFPSFFRLSHTAPPPEHPETATTAPGYAGQLYVKGPSDLALLAWTIVLVSLFRLLIGGYATSMRVR
ncbi:hypothetical protein C8R44DRAFT_857909 [Mycena epipterygia]|nr:hypothetical protein C8R44DRAFT_857909 [Mycena epipterygia]